MKIRIIVALIIVIALAIAVKFLYFNKEESADIIIKPSYGKFNVTVTTSGELRAKNSIEIRGPMQATTIEIYQMKISKLIPEGTVVDSGAFVAELDKTDVLTKIKDEQLNIEQERTKLLQSKLDSTLTLTQARNEIENYRYSMEEQKLLIEQSKYEPPATKRQAEMNYEKAERAYKQAVNNYETKVQKALTDISIINTDLSKKLKKLSKLMSIMSEFTIKAPAAGMVIYSREWDGRKITVGSTVAAWNPTVAELPDLTEMESVTYVNETDIQKLKTGQKVKIALDADPAKKLSGIVKSVANIGEQRRNSDSKVFEVVITVLESGTMLRPAMTTSNEIKTATIDNSIFVPLECIHSSNDTTFVYKSVNGSPVKQIVKLGLVNDNEAIIKKGLKKDDEIYLSVPAEFKSEVQSAVRKNQ